MQNANSKSKQKNSRTRKSRVITQVFLKCKLFCPIPVLELWEDTDELSKSAYNPQPSKSMTPEELFTI